MTKRPGEFPHPSTESTEKHSKLVGLVGWNPPEAMDGLVGSDDEWGSNFQLLGCCFGRTFFRWGKRGENGNWKSFLFCFRRVVALQIGWIWKKMSPMFFPWDNEILGTFNLSWKKKSFDRLSCGVRETLGFPDCIWLASGTSVVVAYLEDHPI